jgi:hypothetical protein
MNEGTMAMKLNDPFVIRPEKPFYSSFPIKNLKTLNFSNIYLVNDELIKITPKFIILKLLKNLFLHNNLLELASDAKNGTDSICALRQLMMDMDSLCELSLWGNSQCDEVYINTIISEPILSVKLKFFGINSSSTDETG